MSEAEKFIRKLKDEKVEGIDVKMMPLGASDLDLMEGMDKKSKTEQINITKKLIKRSIPDSTDEEINDMSLEFISGFQDAIMRINNLDKKEDKGKEKEEFLENIRKKQNLPPA